MEKAGERIVLKYRTYTINSQHLTKLIFSFSCPEKSALLQGSRLPGCLLAGSLRLGQPFSALFLPYSSFLLYKLVQ